MKKPSMAMKKVGYCQFLPFMIAQIVELDTSNAFASSDDLTKF